MADHGGHDGGRGGSHDDALAALAPVIEIGEIKGTVLRAGRLFAEAIVVPTVLLTVLLNTAGLVAGLAAAVGWCCLTLALRWVFTRQLPGTLLLGACMVAAKAGVALATSSALVYLLSPALGSVFMALLFVGSALLGKPITLRLARDFVSVPDHVLSRRGVRRMFTEVAVIWGLSRVLDAGTSLFFLHHGIQDGLFSRSFISPAITLGAVAACTFWGVRSLRRHGVSVRMRPAAAPGA
jgi:hypothetical protein